MHNDPLEGEEKDFASAVSTEAAAAAESFATVYCSELFLTHERPQTTTWLQVVVKISCYDTSHNLWKSDCFLL